MSRHILSLVLLTALAVPLAAQPIEHDAVYVYLVDTLPPATVGVAYEPIEGAIYALAGSGDLYRKPLEPEGPIELVAEAAEQGEGFRPFGIDIGPDGTIYLVGSRTTETMNVGVLRRGRAEGQGRVWTTVAETEPYPLGRTAYDHSVSAVAVHPSGEWLAVNSGSRTDHGEVQDAEGDFPGLREVPLTSAILRVPADATDLVIPADSAALVDGGFLFADGTRNSFGLAFAPDGELFGAENSGDRDDGEELNWLREGHHYGFPWRMGTNDTPQQFPGYDPDADPLVQPESGAYQNGDFYDDPTYPAPPAGVTFSDPLRNAGPDADELRLPDGTIVDASEMGMTATTFTPHRSPLGLSFIPADTGIFTLDQLGCDAVVLSWTDGEDDSGSLLAPFDDTGEDLLCLDLHDDRERVEARRLVSGFRNPIDTALEGAEKLYVAEFSEPYGLWAVEINGADVGPTPEDAIAVAVAPNPLRGGGEVAVTLAAAGPARVRLVDALGRTVATLHDGLLPAGTARLDVEAEGLAAGTYLAVVEAGGARVVRPLTVAR
ncbi:PQQ-dependent sugar dehydrogenase [Rubrivirga marina]|uniref:Glucose/Sorbosone dehydrogenase domain-containing protein n=1 Tax=Rubrivirga marina TaxID=1196024 RepID=A0A271IVP9_9BACT|nr:PQQ-dependent sugar dehydrogenase [Rubrivirga marina]PAP75190.1 hypothetical protein BSZ37_01395 [Rubrivirga marina]